MSGRQNFRLLWTPTDSVTFLVVNPPVGASQTYQWNFGVDAIPQTSSLPSPPPVTYSSGGVKIVTLTVSFKGCTDTHATNFRVESSPTLIAGPDRSYCEGDGGVQIDASARIAAFKAVFAIASDRTTNSG